MDFIGQRSWCDSANTDNKSQWSPKATGAVVIPLRSDNEERDDVDSHLQHRYLANTSKGVPFGEEINAPID